MASMVFAARSRAGDTPGVHEVVILPLPEAVTTSTHQDKLFHLHQAGDDAWLSPLPPPLGTSLYWVLGYGSSLVLGMLCAP
jgi:hypothetical protein